MNANAPCFIFQQTGIDKKFWVTPGTAEHYADAVSAYIKNYVRTAGAKGVVIGMSGGLDSAIAGALCARAGVDVHAVLLPSGDSMQASGSETRATEISEKFGWPITIFDIQPACEELGADNYTKSHATAKDVAYAKMNMQAIIRIAKLREIARLENRLLLGTDNLTELILGYFTKDGNGCDLRPIAAFMKRELYMLAPVIGVPQSIINAAPSAELSPDQTDESELGFTYMQADDFIELGTSGDAAVDKKITAAVKSTQHKRTRPGIFTCC